VDPNGVKKVLFVSGKHYYTLLAKREELKRKDIAIVRVESLCPFPAKELQVELARFKNAQCNLYLSITRLPLDCVFNINTCSSLAIVWSQEEHQNMGAWTFIKPRFENFIGRKVPTLY